MSFLKNRISGSLKLGRALQLMWASGPIWTMANLILLILQGTLPLSIMFLTKKVIDAITLQNQHDMHYVLILLAVTAAITLVLTVCRSIAKFVFIVQSQAITDFTHNLIHEKSTQIDLEYYDNSDYHDMLHRALEEAVFRPTRIANGLTQAGQNIISLFAVAGLLLMFNWKIALILFATAIPGLFVRVKYAEQVYKWHREVTEKRRHANYYDTVLTRDNFAKEIRVFGLKNVFSEKYKELCGKLRHAKLQLAVKHLPTECAAELGAIAALFGSYAYIAYKALAGAITVGSLVMYFQAFQRGLVSLQQTLAALSDLYEDNLFLSSLDEFLDLKPIVKESKRPKDVPHPIRSGIVFDHVSFAYPNADRNAIDDISFKINPGEIVALVGENGSGKSTLIKLLCRLYDPTNGSITIDNIDLHELSTVSLRKEIGVIFQDYAKYNVSARNNIWFGDVSVGLNQDSIVAAAHHSGADRVITKLKHGYDTILGKTFQDGEELSIGQWQKLALARAFLRNAQIIVLDEPTSAMDPNAEYDFFENFRCLAKGRSAIIISHRFSTVKMADKIYVMQRGSIIESGTHKELVERGKLYARLFEKQAHYYR